MIKFILASNSPRRKELLPLCYDKEFIVIPADIDESSIKDENIDDKIKSLIWESLSLEIQLKLQMKKSK